MNKEKLKETYVTHKVGNLEMNIYQQRGAIPYHWHDELELIYVTKGHCKCIINGEAIVVNEGDALLVQSGELHTVDLSYTLGYYAIVFHPHMCGSDCIKFFSGDIKFNRIFSHTNECEKKILTNISYIYEAFHKKNYAYELKIKSLVADIMSTIFENNLYSKRSPEEINPLEAFEQILEYIHTKYSDIILLDNLCFYSNYSKSYIIRLFKKYTGKTPIDYINTYRLYKAQELLENTDKSILDISYECGFDNVSYFIRLFKKHIGVTPGKFKKHIKENI